jgi:hypothetical protein
MLVARLLRQVLVGALWRGWRGWSSLVLSACSPFGYIGPRWGWGCCRWCYAFFDYGGDPHVRARVLFGVCLLCDALRLQLVGTQASWHRLGRTPLRPRPRHRWCRRTGWSRMRVAFRLRRQCSAVAGSRLTIAVRLPRDASSWDVPPAAVSLTLACDRCACAAMGFLIGQLSPRFLGVTSLSFLLMCVVGCVLFLFLSLLLYPL